MTAGGILCWLRGRKISIYDECKMCLYYCPAYVRCIHPEKCVWWYGENCLVSEYGFYYCPEKR